MTDHQQRIQTYRFIVSVGITALVALSLEVVWYRIESADWLLLPMGLLGVLCAALAYSYWLLRQAKADLARGIGSYSMLVVAMLYAPLVPDLYPVLAAVPLVVVAAHVPFITGRALTFLLAAGVLCTVTAATLGAVLPSRAPESSLPHLLNFVGLVGLSVIAMLLFASFASQLREQMSRVHESNLRLEESNAQLEAFAYSVSHDLRAPLRTIDGFSLAALEDGGEGMDPIVVRHLERVRKGAQRMGRLIDDLLALSHVGRVELGHDKVDVSALASEILEDLRSGSPERVVDIEVQEGLRLYGDPDLTRIVFENLLGNAWKFTGDRAQAQIRVVASQIEGRDGVSVQDNGAGFDQEYASKLFEPFRRLHTESEFEGTGIGLATVFRIVSRHGGHISGSGVAGEGATFQVTLTEPPPT